MNRVCLVAAATTVLTVFRAPTVFAQTVSYDVIVDVTSGPLTGDRYTGITSVEVDSLVKDGNNIFQPVSITFDAGGIEFTDANDVRDIDANSPSANFQNGEFLGATYIVSRFGNNPTDIPPINGVSVDGFAIDNSKFGYVVGANLYKGMVNYGLPPESSTTNPTPQPVPEPSLWLGLAMAGCWLTRRAG